ncbi:Ig-like domain-containing protein [Methanobrevibacter olleyae]|uniref:Adhesin-like protein n=1 Tax=Methanobrevibacter olleyae TaxID=294671 RepID=A0A126QZQ4_METOL|nr:Ig-like domain-containing protein [Methanobrevibacter olleyae]AMK15296.1 adhesin-like protein [Methanobrevibacter olleyae]
MTEHSLKITENAILRSSGENNSAINQNTDNPNITNTSLGVSKEKTSISLKSTSVLRGTSLYVYLKDNAGNPLSGKNIILTFANKKFTKVTDKNGGISLKISSASTGKYAVKVNFNGDNDYFSSNKDFTVNVYRLNTKITISSKSIARGTYLYAYLKDSSGKAISGQKITIKHKGKTFRKTTNSKGRVSLKINSLSGKYSTKIKFAGSTSYLASSNSFTMSVYKQKTNIAVDSTSVVRGKYLYAYLKNSKGNPLASKKIVIRFNGKPFYKTTNKDGRVSLKINSKAGSYSTKITYAGSGHYKSSSKSFKLKSYIAKTKINIENSSVVRGKYFYAHLKDSSNKALSNEKVVITFGSTKYRKTTDSKGKVGLKINANPNDYSVNVKYAGSTSYKSSSKSLTLKVLTNATAKIIVKSSTPGEYTVKITDMNGNPLANQTVTITTYKGNQSAGSGVGVTKKTIVLNSDNIYNKEKDIKLLNDIASILESNGYNVIVNKEIGPNAHSGSDIKGKYKNSTIFCIFSGVCAGTLVDMSANWYKYYLNKYDNQVKIGIFSPTTKINLATEDWLNKAHDDEFSGLTGLENPGTYVNKNGMDYVYGYTASEMANNFLKYAANGLSIGKDNTLPCIVEKYTVTTDENGLATISGLTSGNYKITTSYSNTALGYIADTVTTTLSV